MPKRKKHQTMVIDPRTIKVRKRIAPGTRVIKSAKDKEHKHKPNYLDYME